MRNIMSRLWGRLFGAVEPVIHEATPAPAAVTPEAEELIWTRIANLMGASSSAAPERVNYKMPTLLPGVRPEKLPTKDSGLTLAMDAGGEEPMAMDAGVEPAAWGFGSGAIGPGLAFLGFPYLAELAQITEYRTPAESLSTEMTRRWMKLKSKGAKASDPEGKKATDEKISEIEARFEELKVRALFREAALKTEMFGRAHIYISIKNQDDDATRQLPLTKVEKGSLLRLTCVEPYWLTPYSWNATHPERADFYKPQSWFMLGRKTHASRLCTFVFREVPDLLKPAYDFAGISMTQLMMPYVNRWLRTAKSVNDLINIFSIVTLSTDLMALLKNPAEFLKRMQTFVHSRDNKGMMMVNYETEELGVQNVTLGTLDKLQAQAQEHMATPGRMPLIKFFGITPSGLNASSEGEFQAWYDYCAALQELGYSPHLVYILGIVQMDLYGSIDPDITHEWLSLYEPTGKEKAEERAADANRDGVYIEKNVVSPDEVRDRIRMDPESGYEGLEGAAPEPQEWNGGPEPVAGGPDDDDKPPPKKD